MNRPFRVLIADDEKPVAAGLQGQLESLGYDVVAVVNDGHHAIEVCRRTLPDVVLMDIEMPGLDGLSAARQIVRDPGTPVIILTAHGHPNLIDQAVEDGVLYYLLKPVTSPSLHAALQVAVARAREIKTLRENVNTLELTLRERKLIERAKGILMTAAKPARARGVPAPPAAEPGPPDADGQARRVDRPGRRAARVAAYLGRAAPPRIRRLFARRVTNPFDAGGGTR